MPVRMLVRRPNDCRSAALRLAIARIWAKPSKKNGPPAARTAPLRLSSREQRPSRAEATSRVFFFAATIRLSPCGSAFLLQRRNRTAGHESRARAAALDIRRFPLHGHRGRVPDDTKRSKSMPPVQPTSSLPDPRFDATSGPPPPGCGLVPM